LNLQIIQKKKKIEKLENIINWYKKITGINHEQNFDNNELNNELNDNNFNYVKENDLKQKILNLKEKILTLTEKKNYYKSKV